MHINGWAAGAWWCYCAHCIHISKYHYFPIILVDVYYIHHDQTSYFHEKWRSFFTHSCFRRQTTVTLLKTLFASERASSQLSKTYKIFITGALFMKIYQIMYRSRISFFGHAYISNAFPMHPASWYHDAGCIGDIRVTKK